MRLQLWLGIFLMQWNLKATWGFSLIIYSSLSVRLEPHGNWVRLFNYKQHGAHVSCFQRYTQHTSTTLHPLNSLSYFRNIASKTFPLVLEAVQTSKYNSIMFHDFICSTFCICFGEKERGHPQWLVYFYTSKVNKKGSWIVCPVQTIPIISSDALPLSSLIIGCKIWEGSISTWLFLLPPMASWAVRWCVVDVNAPFISLSHPNT